MRPRERERDQGGLSLPYHCRLRWLGRSGRWGATVSDVVTGKFDVREAAAALPEFDPIASDDQADDFLDSDFEIDLEETDVIPEEVEA